MSIEALNWALTQMQTPDLPTSSRFVLMILANRADPEGVCWPSHQYIQDRTGLSADTVRRACRTLEECELITVTQRIRENGAKTSSHYQLGIPPPPPPMVRGTPPAQLGEAPRTVSPKTNTLDGGVSRVPTSKPPEEEDQGQNQPPRPPCSKCHREMKRGGVMTKIGEVCHPCAHARIQGKWSDEPAEATA